MNIASELITEGKKLRIIAKGYSMYPTIKPGYTVYLESYKSRDEVNPGDIIALKQNEIIILHRIIFVFESENKKYLMTRGDASLTSDAPVEFNQIIGKAVLIETEKKKWEPVRVDFIPERKYLFNKRKVWVILNFRKMIKILRDG